MYRETRCRVRVGDERSECFWTKRGVRQGCPLSPTLFNLYIAEELGPEGIMIGKERITIIEYADDVVLMADKEESLRAMLRSLEKLFEW